jgi:hypothetical protein
MICDIKILPPMAMKREDNIPEPVVDKNLSDDERARYQI